MITQIVEYKNIILQRLDENRKSFDLLYGIKHYGNCISIMCQELEQTIKILFLLNQNESEQKQFIEQSINNRAWFTITRDNKKEYITEEKLIQYSDTLSGWDKSKYEFGLAFGNIANTYNFGTKDPIMGISENDKGKIYRYIAEYHNKTFPQEYSLNDLIIELPTILNMISNHLINYLDRVK